MANETKTYRLEGEIRLLAPLSHIGESHGTDSYLSQDFVIDEAGRPVEVFTYSGNAFRGQMRDCGTQYLLDALGGLKLPIETFHLLFAGGALGSETCIDIDRARIYRKSLPLLSIFGGGTGNQIMAGKLRVGQMYPVTKECSRILPEKYRRGDLPSWRSWTMEKSFTRMDDTKNEHLRPYLHEAPAAQQQGLLPGAAGDQTEAAKKEKKERPEQMRYTVEALAPGALLYQRIDLIHVTQIELGAWISCLAQWSKSPHIGGKANVGFGLCEAHWAYTVPGEQEEALPFATVAEMALALGPGEPADAKARYDEFLLHVYQQYIEGKQEELKKLLMGGKGA